MSEKPYVHTTQFYDRNGETLLWEEPMYLSRLYKKGDLVIEKGITYTVRRVAIAKGVQIVNFTGQQQKWKP